MENDSTQGFDQSQITVAGESVGGNLAASQKLIDNGVLVTQKRYPGMIHLFYAMTNMFEDGHDVYHLINEELSKQKFA